MKNLALLTWTEDWSKRSPGRTNLWTRFHKAFSQAAKKEGIKIFVAHRSWCDGKVLEKAYTLEKGKWKKVYDIKFKLAYIYFSINPKRLPFMRKLQKTAKIINRLELDKICCDKFATYKFLPKKNAIPTILVKNKREAKRALKKFGNRAILKPRFGIRGIGIRKITPKRIPKIKKGNIVQPLIDTTQGIPALGIKGRHDLRLILVNGKLHHAYVRIPPKGSIKGNCAQGARKIFIPNNKIPEDIIKIQKGIAQKFAKLKPSIYSIDFIVDKDQKPYVIELESHLGFLYYPKHFNIRKACFSKIFKAIKTAYC
jgi:glutathione synthase/RimK-type ligase-like ATP-grasp enzyme